MKIGDGSEKTEYRIVGERFDGTPWEGSGRSRELNWDLENEQRELSKRNRNVRIQKRIVTVTSWKDITDAKD